MNDNFIYSDEMVFSHIYRHRYLRRGLGTLLALFSLLQDFPP